MRDTRLFGLCPTNYHAMEISSSRRRSRASLQFRHPNETSHRISHYVISALNFLVVLTGTRRDKVKCLWYKNVGQELVEIKWNVYDIRMSIDFRLKLEKSFYSHPFFQNIYLSIFGSIRNGKSFYLLFENIHPLWYLCAHARSNSLQHDIKKLLFDTLKLLFKLFAWVFLEKQTLKLTLIIVNLESHAIDKKWKGEHPPSPLPLSPDPPWIRSDMAIQENEY